MSGKPDVLIINSYAGSLTVGAHAAKFDVRGSYEDSGYGLVVQRENFPKLDYRPTYADWPKRQDLSSTIVLAHPPCSAFSQMTPRYMEGQLEKLHGTGSGAFQCTISVLDYSMRNKAVAVCVESVPKALEGARGVHEAFAKKHGYDLYRVMQNAATFGAPQYRTRFWAIFVRRGATKGFALQAPQVPVRRVEDIVHPNGTAIERDEEQYAEQVVRLSARWDRKFAREALQGKWGYGPLAAILMRRLKQDGELMDVKVPVMKTGREYDAGSQNAVSKAFCLRGPFFTNILRVLDPKALAPTLLGCSWWALPGRTLNMEEYKLIMGFPADYKFPPKSLRKFREYLSKGVCPPVAKWVLEQTAANLMGRAGRGQQVEPGGTHDITPGSRDEFKAEAA